MQCSEISCTSSHDFAPSVTIAVQMTEFRPLNPCFERIQTTCTLTLLKP